MLLGVSVFYIAADEVREKDASTKLPGPQNTQGAGSANTSERPLQFAAPTIELVIEITDQNLRF